MNWQYVVSILLALIGAGGGLFYRSKYRAEVNRTSADTGKISAETITTLLKAVDEATRGFNEQLKAVKAEWAAERNAWQTEREKWIAERALERAIWKERELKLEKENLSLREEIRSGVIERHAIKAALNAIKIQISVFEELPDQLRRLQATVDQWEQSGPPSKDPVLENDDDAH